MEWIGFCLGEIRMKNEVGKKWDVMGGGVREGLELKLSFIRWIFDGM
jgi:hypothetical protein